LIVLKVQKANTKQKPLLIILLIILLLIIVIIIVILLVDSSLEGSLEAEEAGALSTPAMSV
jgi:hypothetical protein